jgi:hypothetical protein
MHDTAIWSEIHYQPFCCDPPTGNYVNYGINFIMMGDTIIDNLPYKKIFYQQLWCNSNGSFCPSCSGSQVSPPIMLGFVREDSSKKVFFRSYFNSIDVLPVHCSQELFESEKILYDFGLQIGDTVPWKPYNKVVTTIDSTQAPDGEFLRKIVFQLYETDYWIEGLGSSIGFFGSYTFPPFECDCELSCAEATDLLPPGSPSPCGGIVNAVTQPYFKQELEISPNPFSDLISLTSPFQSSSILSAINSQGRIIFNKQLHPVEKIVITNQELKTKGLILFRLISEDGVSVSATTVHAH